MITIDEYGQLPSGERVFAYRLGCAHGFQATILNYGATLQSLIFPDGKDVVLGFDKLEHYLSPHPFFGAVIGRVANRISGSAFSLGHKTFPLLANEGPNNLHSGPHGFDTVLWNGQIERNTLVLRHTSPAGTSGFPGDLSIVLTFSLVDGVLRLEFLAKTSAPTPVNLTYHPYFNFCDDPNATLTNHSLWIDSRYVLETDKRNIPSGRLLPLKGTRYDYTNSRFERAPGKLDHCFVLRNQTNLERDAPVVLMSKGSRKGVSIHTDQMACQVYTGDKIPKMRGKGEQIYGARSGIAVEPQDFLDAPNRPDFPEITLRPGELYRRFIAYRFFH